MGEYTLIETKEDVEALAKRLARERVIALDTEADSFFHYFDKLCLLQIACRAGIFLIDPLALPPKALAPLEPVLADPDVRTVLHAADYDLYVLQRHSGLKMRNIFDTMISAQLLGYPAVGLGALVERHFDVKLSKDQQRTDWSRRPLRKAQIDYAASDVHYLVELAQILEKELRAKKRLEWAQEEFKLLEKKAWPERQFDDFGYLRIKGSKKLTPQGLAIIRELFLVRDRRARELDKPPFKVLGNGTLLELAQNPPRSRRALARRKGITDLVLRRLGGEILDAVTRGVEGPEHPPLEPKPQQGDGRRRLDRRGEVRLKHLKRWRAQHSKELDLDPGVLCPNAVLEQVAWGNPRNSTELGKLGALRGWRLAAFGKDLLEVVRVAESSPEPEADRKRDARPATSARRGGSRRRSEEKRARKRS